MTNSYDTTVDSSLTAQQASTNDNLARSTDPLPKYFPEAPISFEITNNEYTSGPYYYDRTRNSWIFYIPGTDIPNPPADPDGGNLWIDPTEMYLMYVYNQNEMQFEGAVGQRWYALTTNKRAYDYLIVPISDDGDNVNTLVPTDRVNIFKQGYLYFNNQDVDLKVKASVEGDPESQAWASITQRGIQAVEDPDANFNDVLPTSALRSLRNTTDDLQKRVDVLVALTNTIN